jgi:TRAP-type C4-dicarboxylate transport system permease small subunit
MFQRVFTLLEDWFAKFGALAIFLMIFFVTADVGARYLFNSPIVGQMEMTEILMVVGVFPGLAYTQRMRGHIGMDFIIRRIPEGRLSHLITLVTTFFSLLIYVAIACSSLNVSLFYMKMGTKSIFLPWPTWPLPFIVSVGSFFLCIRFLIELKSQVIVAFSKERRKGELTPR